MGQSPRGPTRFHPPGSPHAESQTRQVFTNLKTALEAAGTDFAHVVKLTFYLVDISKIALVRGIRDEFVDTRHPPASTAVEVRRLVREEFLLAVDSIATAPA